ncbi:MAG: DNA alkylation repair protein [Ruminococcaceae bacterium]|nr:DNA alkylation repair protein [Oscillospiraceae bacterium]
MSDLCEDLKEQLYRLSDPEYRVFQSALLPTVPLNRVIGVRVPALRRLARQMTRAGQTMPYLSGAVLPHSTYDEDNLHAFLIEGIDDYGSCMAELQRFLPYIDNWATCDLMAPPVLGTQPEHLYKTVKVWLESAHEFTVRYGLVTLMRHFLDERYSRDVLYLVSAVTHEGYYVKMAAAWLMAEALAGHWEDAYPFLASEALPVWTRKKAVQKALESRKLTPEQKSVLRILREEMKSE